MRRLLSSSSLLLLLASACTAQQMVFNQSMPWPLVEGKLRQSPDGSIIYVSSLFIGTAAIRASDGALLWEVDEQWQSLGAVTDKAAVLIERSQLTKDPLSIVNPETGKSLWAPGVSVEQGWKKIGDNETLFGAVLSSPDGSLLYAAKRGANNTLYALRMSDASVEWEADMSDLSDAGVVPAHSTDDNLYVTIDGQQLVALSPTDGSVRWATDYGDFFRVDFLSNDLVYIQNLTHARVLSPEDGSVLHSFLEFSMSPEGYYPDRIEAVEFAKDGSVVVLGCVTDVDGYRLRAFDTSTGNALWTYRGSGSLVMKDSHDVLVLLKEDGAVALGLRSGAVEWKWQAAGGDEHYDAPSDPKASSDDMLFVGNGGFEDYWNVTMALDILSGKPMFDMAATNTSAVFMGVDGSSVYLFQNLDELGNSTVVKFALPEAKAKPVQLRKLRGRGTSM